MLGCQLFGIQKAFSHRSNVINGGWAPPPRIPIMSTKCYTFSVNSSKHFCDTVLNKSTTTEYENFIFLAGMVVLEKKQV